MTFFYCWHIAIYTGFTLNNDHTALYFSKIVSRQHVGPIEGALSAWQWNCEISHIYDSRGKTIDATQMFGHAAFSVTWDEPHVFQESPLLVVF